MPPVAARSTPAQAASLGDRSSTMPGSAADSSRALRERNNVHEMGNPDGQPIVFVHGYGCDQSMWRFVAPEFAADHRVIVFDQVGFGGSDLAAWDPIRHRDLAGYAQDLLELLAGLDLRDVVFVGHSVAGMIGVLAANREPDRFARLVLVGPSPRYLDDPEAGYVGGFGSGDVEELISTLDANHLAWAAAMAPVIMGNAGQPELAEELRESFCRTDVEVARVFVRATFLADNRADLSSVSVPTLVLQAADDPIAPEVVGRFVQSQIPGSELALLEATGHCPNLSAPGETAAAIRRYLAAHGLD
jgi:sigma-B regulation protein RsbQ